jgi:uncharacterized protein YqjF (DUF2071 family)
VAAADTLSALDFADSYDPTPGPEPARVVMSQRWTELTYLHWPYDPASVAPLLPAGTVPDTFGGVTWIGLIAFWMRDVRVLGSAPVPYLSSFLETNVRAYARDGQGRRSVVFFSLDASRLLPVAVARTSYRIPYIWSTMRRYRNGDEVSYLLRRRVGPAASRITVRIGAPLTATPLDHFLTARWGLHSRWYGVTSYVPIIHEPWPLQAAELIDLDDSLVLAAGLPAPSGPPRVLYSPGVHVRLGTPQRLRHSAPR